MQTARNLAIVWAPTLLRKENRTPVQMLSDSEKAVILVELFITQYDRLFAVCVLCLFCLTSAQTDNYPSMIIHERETEETRAFYETLRVCTAKLMKTQLKGCQHRSLC